MVGGSTDLIAARGQAAICETMELADARARELAKAYDCALIAAKMHVTTYKAFRVQRVPGNRSFDYFAVGKRLSICKRRAT